MRSGSIYQTIALKRILRWHGIGKAYRWRWRRHVRGAARADALRKAGGAIIMARRNGGGAAPALSA